MSKYLPTVEEAVKIAIVIVVMSALGVTGWATTKIAGFLGKK